MALKLMNEKEKARWRRIRAKGLRRFVTRETITFGLSSAIAIITWDSLESIWTGKLEFSTKVYRYLFVPAFVAICGFIGSHFRWIKQEDRYVASRKSMERQKTNV